MKIFQLHIMKVTQWQISIFLKMQPLQDYNLLLNNIKIIPMIVEETSQIITIDLDL
jgi:hypothetical protein